MLSIKILQSCFAKQKCLVLMAGIGWLAWGAVLPSPLIADIYKYTDEEGGIHLTNVPSAVNARYVLLMRETPVHFNLGKDINKYDDLIAKYSQKYNVDSALVKAIIKAESNFNHQATSRVGAKGLMQLMPATASFLQVRDSFHPENNIEGGVRYFRYLLNTYSGNVTLALAAYNAGEGAVSKHDNRVPPYRETQIYIQRVMNYFAKYSKPDR
jgi:soluble lytic murein transglycosylase-like protein